MVASIYCNYKDKMTQTPVNLLANIWSQIRQKDSLDPEVEALYDRHSNARPRLDDICKILRAEVNRHTKVFVIIDALDECEPAYRLRLLTELRALQPKLKLMVTSRFFDAIGADMGVDTDIEILASDTDIKRYIQRQRRQLLDLQGGWHQMHLYYQQLWKKLLKQHSECESLAQIHCNSQDFPIGFIIQLTLHR